MSKEKPLELTTEEKLKTLADAGKTVPKTATEEEIEMAFLELEIEQESGEEDVSDDVLNPIVDSDPETVGEMDADAAYLAVLKSADPAKGDKDPNVIEWCRQNLSPDDFEAKYAGHV